ncbi:hypothetical protein DAPPUDRAFT_57088 [Daphnia pulex]|uniref:Ion transport peptide-like protein n=1 Tax=Daphnia pulex TaxID=6669 RepID=E9H1P1_DAPPU|nr:hypothetical protein DAPPUDRAFT_57088 [Daphnia pulex]|eukprot:EFX74385.1 hypothetical protein DAPPUDRAFT_57088 [Daphnia pulex]
MASLILAEQPPGISIFPHPLSKHSFTEISKCDGVYDMNIYAQFNQICLNCYNLYRQPEIYRGCRKECFTSEYFGGCLAVLQITDKKDKILEDLSIIHRQMESPKEN